MMAGRGGARRSSAVRVIAMLVLVSTAIRPGAAPARAQTAADLPTCEDWAEMVIGPAERALKPVGAWWSNGEQLREDELAGLLEADAAGPRLSQPGQALVVDFGEVVSGKVEADFLDASGVPVVFSTSESLEFLSLGSDTTAYGNGDLVHKPGRGAERWHAFARRTFRYLLVTLPEAGWADVDRIGVYFTAALGPPSAFRGWFRSSDPLLDRIWYRAAYTLQLVSAAGNSSALDGALEVWRGQLDMAAALESRLLLTGPGADWRDYTFDFDITIPAGGAGGGWAIRATPNDFVAFRLQPPSSDGPSQLQVWRGTRGGAAAFVASRSLPFEVRRGQPYHVRVDVAGDQVVTLIDRRQVSTDGAAGLSRGKVGFWAAAGDRFNVAQPRVFSADGALLFEDTFGAALYLDPTRWDNTPQPMLLDGAKRDRAMAVADLAIAARGRYASFGEWDSVGRLLSRFGAHQYADGKLPGGLLGGDVMAPPDDRLPDYTLWWILAISDYVQQSGDMRAAEAQLPRVQAALAWAERSRRADGLLAKGPGEDWYWTVARGSGPTTSFNALYVGSLRVAADLADLLQRPELRDEYLRRAADVRAAVNGALWDAAAGAYVDGDLREHHPLDGNALAIVFGVADDERAAAALSFLRDQLWTPSGTLTADRAYGGWAHDFAVWPAFIYPEVEARFSVDDNAAALELVRRTWGNMLAHDPSSTFWEFATAEGAVRDGSISLAHGWSTGALPALSRWVLGVRTIRPGYAEYVIDPHPGDLTWACGAVPTPAGPIHVAWRQDDSGFRLQYDAPSGTVGRFVVPKDASEQVLLDGQAVATAPISPTRTALLDLPPGPHVIEVERVVLSLPT